MLYRKRQLSLWSVELVEFEACVTGIVSFDTKMVRNMGAVRGDI